MAMDIGERRMYVRMLSERIEAENQEFEFWSKRMVRGLS
jgi:hypothetical protein